ncbi:MAG: helix-turn-helix domain-containing protein [Acidimicrobiales bacterium]
MQKRTDADKYTAEQLRFPELVNIATLARLLAVDERYVRRMILERRVPTVKVGRLVRFDLADIRKWVEEQRRPPLKGRGGSVRVG